MSVDVSQGILGIELLPRKIRVNLMSLSPTDTEIFQRGTTPEQQAAMREMTRNNAYGTFS